MKYLLLGFIALNRLVQAQSSDYLTWVKQSLDRLNTYYPSSRLASFAITNERYALTFLYKDKAEKSPPLIFWASIVGVADGADLGFKSSRACVSRGDELQERIISVSGQKIQANYMCAKLPSGDQEVYVIKTNQGKMFVRGEFEKREMVVVELDGLPVPFQTDGFVRAWDKSSGKAL